MRWERKKKGSESRTARPENKSKRSSFKSSQIVAYCSAERTTIDEQRVNACLLHYIQALVHLQCIFAILSQAGKWAKGWEREHSLAEQILTRTKCKGGRTQRHTSWLNMSKHAQCEAWNLRPPLHILETEIPFLCVLLPLGWSSGHHRPFSCSCHGQGWWWVQALEDDRNANLKKILNTTGNPRCGSNWSVDLWLKTLPSQ